MKKMLFWVVMGMMVLGICRLPAEAATVEKEGAKVGVWTQDWDSGIKLAKEKSLPILVNFTGSDWCGWCKLMEREVFAKDQWAKYAQKKLVLLWIDFPQNTALVPEAFVQRNQKLAKEFGIRGFPTFVLLKADGKTELGRLHASRSITPEIFIGQIEEKLPVVSAPASAK